MLQQQHSLCLIGSRRASKRIGYTVQALRCDRLTAWTQLLGRCIAFGGLTAGAAPYPGGNLLPATPCWFGLDGKAPMRAAIIAFRSIRSFFLVFSVYSLVRRATFSTSANSDIFASVFCNCMKIYSVQLLPAQKHCRDHLGSKNISDLLSRFFAVPAFQPLVQLAVEFDLPPAQRGAWPSQQRLK